MQGMVVASFTGSEKERGPAAFGIWGGGGSCGFLLITGFHWECPTLGQLLCDF